MFKVNNKDTRSLSLTLNITPCSSVSIVNFEHVNADRDESIFILQIFVFSMLSLS